jgi:hypothetical protein
MMPRTQPHTVRRPDLWLAFLAGAAMPLLAVLLDGVAPLIVLTCPACLLLFGHSIDSNNYLPILVVVCINGAIFLMLRLSYVGVRRWARRT